MSKQTKRDINFLKIYSALLTIALLVVVFYVIPGSKQQNFEEINAERINIVESNGDLKLVISNSQRQHNGIINEQPLPERGRPAGLIFFNGIGDECGGLLYDSNKEGAGFILSVDKFRDDQLMQFKYEEAVGQHLRKYGLQFWDYPKENAYDERMAAVTELHKLKTEAERDAFIRQMKQDSLLMNDRMFIGMNMHEEIGLFIKDKNGKPRIKIYINSDNQPVIERLNEEGHSIEDE